MKFLAIGALVLALGGCVAKVDNAKDVLEAEGFSQVQIDAQPPNGGCDETDNARSGFHAVGVNGRHIHGVVCAEVGYGGKGATVRVMGLD